MSAQPQAERRGQVPADKPVAKFEFHEDSVADALARKRRDQNDDVPVQIKSCSGRRCRGWPVRPRADRRAFV
jgi:hypothetical protein